MALPFAAHYLTGQTPVPLKAHLLRRLTRFEPPYIITLLAFFAAAVVFDSQPVSAMFFAFIERLCMDMEWPSRVAAWFGVLRSLANEAPLARSSG